MTKKALVAMSGGVDSSVAAFLTKEAGYETTGVTMRLYDNETVGSCNTKTCCSLSDVEDARSVAFTIGIPYYVLNFTDAFGKEVIERFVQAYEEGKTPNPCIDCNRYIKFKALFQRAKEMGQDYVVTGHYARVAKDEGSGRWLLQRSADPKKDQTYVLFSLTQDQLAHVMFPLEGIEKTETRRIAEEQGFLNARKHDSQDICFAPDGDYAGFICRYAGKTYPEGDFVDLQGNVLGRHRGIIHYTIGQRKGLGLSLPHPMYVCRKDVARNQVVLCDSEQLFTTTFEIDRTNWIPFDRPQHDLHVEAKVRYSQKASPAAVIPLSDTTARVVFDEPQRAITAGQAAVFYDGDTVVGGGTITKTQLDDPAL